MACRNSDHIILKYSYLKTNMRHYIIALPGLEVIAGQLKKGEGHEIFDLRYF
jgi:hypothetical protein